MTKTIKTLVAAAIALGLCDTARAGSEQHSGAHQAHDAYLTAINSNDTEKLLAVVTDDVVYIAPNSPAIVGKSEVGPWVAGYFAAFDTRWEKTTLEFVVSGDWAFERYAYKVVDTLRDGGETFTDTGNGINIYHLEADGVWRVARDAWATDQPVSAN
ncbi:MAG: nuclear transport factor 2 family protein [Gemmatimonadetes bacterium]|nr:nuclear transport factor 2 family protein [Gemmatimonadota bacterium]